MLKPLIYADLVGLSEEDARRALLTAVADQARAKPAHRPVFPGQGTAISTPALAAVQSPRASFPGRAPRGQKALTMWKVKLEFLLEQEAVAYDTAQKFSLSQQIKEAREKIQEIEP
jgi:hypothetical protein